MSLTDILKMTEDKMGKTLHVTNNEFNGIRTGRASVSLVDEIRIDYYNTSTPLKQLATISTPQNNLLVIQPWDASVISEIEKAILKSNLGFMPSNDGKSIRIAVPQLTTEKRQEMVKLAKKIAEDAKISIRVTRRESNENLDKGEDEGTLSEDEVFKGRDKVQKFTDEHIAKIEGSLKEKEEEILKF